MYYEKFEEQYVKWWSVAQWHDQCMQCWKTVDLNPAWMYQHLSLILTLGRCKLMPSAVDKFASVSESIGMSATNGWTLGCKRDVCSRSSSVSWWSILPQQCISIYSSQLVLKMGVARIAAMLTELGLSCDASISVVFWSSWLVEKACRETSRISQCNAISTAMPWLEGLSLVPRLPHPCSRHKKLMSAGMAMQEYLTAHPTRGYSVTVILVVTFFLCSPSNIEDTVQSLL